MGQQPNHNGSCPKGFDKCPFVAEVEQLRVECGRLLQLSITDPLTGFFNYRYMVESLDRELERTRRTGLPTGIIMIDLDHFKNVNDTYGHSAGDIALQWASGLWRQNIRRIDVPCRYGGEEFAIILPGTNLSQATQLAERLRTVLVTSPMKFGDHTITLSASFGVSAYSGNKASSAQRLIDCADHLLIRAKVQGRNRVCSDVSETHKPHPGLTSEEREALFGSRWKIVSSSPCMEDFEEENDAE